MTDTTKQDAPELTYLAFGRRLLSDLSSWTSESGIERRTATEITFTDEGIEWGDKEYSAYWAVIMPHYGEDVWGTPEAEECARVHLDYSVLDAPKMSDSAGNRIHSPSFEQMRSFVVVELLRPLVAALERHDTIALSDEQILQSYRSARATWDAVEYEHRLVIPVVRFDSDIDHLKVGELELSPFLSSEKTDTWWQGILPLGGLDPWEMQRSNFKLVGSCVVRKGVPFDSGPLNRDAQSFVTALRLLKGGSVGIMGAFTGEVRRRPSTYSWPDQQFAVPRASGSDYELLASECKTAVALFQRIRDGFADGSLRSLAVAIRRFNLSYTRSLAEDRIIDLTIALESSLLFDVDAELRYRLSLRGAKLLSQIVPPQDVRSLLGAIYDVRSAIVHRGQRVAECMGRSTVRQVTPQVGTHHDLVVRSEQIVRDVIRTYLQELRPGRSLKDVNSALERGISDSLKPALEDSSA